jgi:DNA repair protein RadC
MYKKLSIKDWAVEDRPREKLILKGTRSLSDAELMAILIGSGSAEESAVGLSRRILTAANNDLNELGKKQVSDFLKFKGIGEAKAVNIVAALELGRRRKDQMPAERLTITASSDAANYFRPLLEDLPVEEFWILLLNRSNTVIDKFMVSQGGLTGTVIDVKIILKTALEKLASAMILCHNHPSGNTRPSEADRNITRKIKSAADMLEIAVLDHIIIAHHQHFSFADEGLI